jgi:hypothetical protein
MWRISVFRVDKITVARELEGFIVEGQDNTLLEDDEGRMSLLISRTCPDSMIHVVLWKELALHLCIESSEFFNTVSSGSPEEIEIMLVNGPTGMSPTASDRSILQQTLYDVLPKVSGEGLIFLVCPPSGRITIRQNFVLLRHYAQTYQHEEKRKMIREREMVLAFPVDKSGVPAIEEQEVHAFMPLKKYGFNVSI